MNEKASGEMSRRIARSQEGRSVHEDVHLSCLKNEIKRLSSSPDFIHREWFVQYHLEVVQSISSELCGKYPEADRKIVDAMVWLHDYGKLIDFQNQDEVTLRDGKAKLVEMGFDDVFAEKVIDYIRIMDSHEGLDRAPIEVQIVSSADGASHLVGPFFTLYWYENPNKSIPDLMRENARKIMVDWEKKIVLPEVKEAFADRLAFLREHLGALPPRYLGRSSEGINESL